LAGSDSGEDRSPFNVHKMKRHHWFLSDAFLRALGGEAIVDADANAIQLKLSMLLTFYN